MTSSNPSSHSTACLRAHPPRVRALREAAAAIGLSFALGCVASTVQAQSVRCWGWNDFGQCDVPTNLRPVSMVAGGEIHTIALKTDGSVRCWGNNDLDQCAVPPDLGPVSMVAGGGYHTIALKTDGSVRCWGYNKYGQCNVPTDLGSVSMVAGGAYHTIALKTDGGVRCWGNNDFGQCAVPTDLGPVSMVAGGYGHTIAISGAASPFTVSLTGSSPGLAPGDTFTVRASCTAPAADLSGAQLTIHFDAARLRLDAVDPVAPAGLDLEIAEQVNNTAGTLRYALGMSNPAVPLWGAADLCDLTFTVLPGSDLCGAAGLVSFGNVGPFTTRFTEAAPAAPVVAVLVDLPAVSLDTTVPVLAGVPSDTTVPADAGSTVGAFVSLPTVTALDNCAAAVEVTASGVPSGAIFPIGTTTVTWSATDDAGNTASVSRTVTVLNHQLLDAHISLNGFLLAAATRSIRVTAGASASVHSVTVPAGIDGVGAIAGIQVPVAASYPCVAAKDTVHSLTRTASASVVGTRYDASFALVQGDSNDDDLVEIVDYATFILDIGAGKARDARSNFNADTMVNNADFSHIGMNFFTVGESCTPGAQAPTPRERISVKELRRIGRGELAAADLNHDGWVDMRDIQIFMQGGGGAVPVPEDAPRGSGDSAS